MVTAEHTDGDGNVWTVQFVLKANKLDVRVLCNGQNHEDTPAWPDGVMELMRQGISEYIPKDCELVDFQWLP